MSKEKIRAHILRQARAYGMNFHPSAMKYLVAELAESEGFIESSEFDKFLKDKLDLLFTVIDQDNQIAEENDASTSSRQLITEEQCKKIFDATKVGTQTLLSQDGSPLRNRDGNGEPSTAPKATSIMVDEVPAFLYDHKSKKWVRERIKTPVEHEKAKSIHPSILMPKSRFDVVHQRILRHPLFEHISVKTGARSQKDFGKEHFVLVSQLTQVNQENTVFVFGLISRTMDKSYFIEDSFAKLPLIFDPSSDAFSYSTHGFVIAHGPVIAKAKWDGTNLNCLAVGLPPGEPRLLSQQWLGHKVDLFGKRAISYTIESHESLASTFESPGKPVESSHSDPTLCLMFSDFYLDDLEVMHSFRSVMKLLLARRGCILSFQSGEKFVESDPASLIFIFCGNFLRYRTPSMDLPSQYKTAFSTFGDMLEKEFPQVVKASQFFFVPGPEDLTQRGQSKVFPQKKIPEVLTKEVLEKLPNAVFASNPLRLRVADNEMVIFRDDSTRKMESECILPNPAVEATFLKGIDHQPFSNVIKTMFDNSHLYPYRRAGYPVFPAEDIALRLFPLPDTVVLCDTSFSDDSAKSCYLDCLAINPGGFSGGKNFAVFHPAGSGISLTNVQDF